MPFLLAVVAGTLLVLAFPPVGWGWTAVGAIALFFAASLRAGSNRRAWLVGGLFAVAFTAPLFRWLDNVETIAWAGFVIAHVPFFAGFSRALWGTRHWSLVGRVAIAVGGWLAIFLALRWLPLLGIEWADPGYTVVGWDAARNAAAVWGATGWGALIAIAATGLAIGVLERRRELAIGGLAVLAAGFVVGLVVDQRPTGDTIEVAIVQGHPPCPTFPCTSTRQEITANHLAMTADLDPGADLVVWGESSAGFATDPGTNPAVAEGIAAETTRLDAHLLMGSDRPLGTLNFANSNMLFSPAGQLLGEYLKQHPVPFGEYVPLRGLIGDIPPFTRQPRDMVPGTGPVILDVDGIALGTVISYEGSFGRYAREHAALGAELLVVATNQGSFGRSAAADQFIAMTSMRSAELGLDVVHAAVSGRSTIITDGGVPGPRTALYEEAVIEGTVTLRDAPPTPYARFGDWLVSTLLLAAGAIVVREAVRRSAGEPSAELDPVDV